MVLINPGYNRRQKLGAFARYVPISVPIGIGYLAAVLLSRGRKAKILDEEVEPITDTVIEESVKGLEPPYLFGFSCLTAGVSRAYELAGIIKRRYPGSKIIFGNIHPTVLPEEVLNTGNVDIVVRGEGEQILDILYGRLKSKSDYTDLDGISFWKGSSIIHNPQAPPPDLKELPLFPYHLFEEHSHRYELGFIASSRGCPYDCIFCSQRCISGRRFRFFPLDTVIEEIEQLISKYKRPCITFTDDSFLMDKDRVMRLCGVIQEKGFNKKVIFDCQARGDTVDRQVLKHLSAANFRTINFGIETASDRLMALINKQETLSQIEEGVKLAKELGFQVSGTFILGLPTETKQERAAAFKLAKDLSLDYVRFNNATPYPGTVLYEIAKKENRLNPGKNWENLNACGTLASSPRERRDLAYIPLSTTSAELRHDILRYNLLYSFRLESICKILKERVGPAGWLALPDKWYLKAGEWFYLIRFGFSIIFSFLKIGIYSFKRIFFSAGP